MRIRTQFILMMVLFGIVLTVILASLAVTNRRVESLAQQQELARNIERQAGELGYLSGEVLLYREGEQRRRWESKFSAFSTDLAKLEPINPEQGALVNSIKANQRRLKEVFGAIVAGFESGTGVQKTADVASIQVPWSRMAVQTLGIVFDASRLSHMMRSQTDQVHKTNLILVLALGGIFVAYFLVNYFLYYRRTLGSIEKLRAGTAVVGSGNLDFAIEEEKDDEIGELSRAFNRMTANLKALTASKAELEREMAERARMEAALRESERKFFLLFQKAPFCCALSRLPEAVLVDVNDEFANVFGFAREEAIGKTSLELGISSDTAARARIIAEIGERGFVRDVEQEFHSKAGRKITALTSISAIDIGAQNYLLSTLVDITARKQAEARQAASVAALTRLHELSTMAMGGRGIQPLLQAIMDTAVANVGAQKGTLQLLEGDTLRILAHHGHEPHFLEFFAAAEKVASVCGDAMERGERVLVEDVEQSPLLAGTASLPVLREAGVRAVQSTPLATRSGRLLGILTTQWAEPHIPDEHDRWRLDLLARQAADLIESAKAEEALRESEERARDRAGSLQAVLDTAPAIIWITHDRECRLITGNHAAYEFSRVTVGENLSKTGPAPGRLAHYRVFHAGIELAPRDMPIQRVAVSGGELSDFEMEFVFDDGSVRSLLGNVRPLYDSAGRSIGAVAAFTDITARKHAEEAARAHRQLLETVVNHIPAAVNLIRGTDLRLQLINPAYQAIAPGKEMLGKTLDELWPETGQDFAQLCRKVLTTGEPHLVDDELNMIRRHPDGPIEVAYFSWTLHRVRLPGEEGWGILNTAWETTERKLAEEALRASQAKLEATNKELDAFAYSVSHDLRAPLRGIDSFSRILQEQYAAHLEDDAVHCLQMIRGNAVQMGRLIDDLLAFSRLSQQPLRKEPVQQDALVRSALRELESEQKGRQIDLGVGELAAAEADPNLLKQVWVNLISNALKYTRGRERAEIRIGSESQDGVPVYFVKDNGVGFDMRYAHRLFGVFQRLHRPEDYEGTGVGLAIVRRIITRHGGRIWTQAAKNQGASFYFTLQSAHEHDRQ